MLLGELLVGQRLFARADLDTTLAAVTGADIAVPSSLRPDVPAKLDEVVMRALDRDVTARWPSAADMLAAINRFLYALDDTPTARDVAALVAKYCPPETRRLATHAEALLLAQVDEGAGAPQVAPPVTPPGPHTAVIPRDGAAARGKYPRAPTRQESFATHVVLRDMLERGTPMLGVAVVNDIEHELDGGATAASGVAAPVNGHADAAPRDDDATPVRPSARVRTIRPEQEARPVGPPPGSMMWLGAVAALGLGVAAVVVFLHGKAAVMRPDAAVAVAPPIDAAIAAPPVDAAVIADVPVDAAVAVVAVDAAARPVPVDAAVRVAAVDAAAVDARALDARPQGTATLVVGADPWGEICRRRPAARQHARHARRGQRTPRRRGRVPRRRPAADQAVRGGPARRRGQPPAGERLHQAVIGAVPHLLAAVAAALGAMARVEAANPATLDLVDFGRNRPGLALPGVPIPIASGAPGRPRLRRAAARGESRRTGACHRGAGRPPGPRGSSRHGQTSARRFRSSCILAEASTTMIHRSHARSWRESARQHVSFR